MTNATNLRARTWASTLSVMCERTTPRGETYQWKKETNLYRPLKLHSYRPSFGVKDGILVLLLNLGQEPPTWSAIGDVVAG